MAEDEIKEETPTDKEINNSNEEVEDQNVQDTKDSEEEEGTKQKKVPFLNKILFGLVAFLLLVLIVGVVLFFMGFFDPEKEVKVEKIQKKEIKAEKENRFNIKDINSKKLNKQLLLLTNKNMIEEENNNQLEKQEEEKKIKKEEEKKEKEALAIEEENISKEKMLLENKKQELEKQKAELEILKNEAILLRNEMINNKELLETQKEEAKLKEIEEIDKIILPVIDKKKETIQHENKFVSLINVAKIKGNLYKSYLDKITAINSDIKLCRDDINRIEIYYGPFKDNSLRNDLYNKLQEKGIENSYKVELTKEEFDRRCNY
jgi:hypothetical protein